MAEPQLRSATTARPVGPGLLAAQRIVQAAEAAAAAGHAGLAWARLRQWPAWAGPTQPPLAWLCTLGACWHAAELQQCIDGDRLNVLCEDLGPKALQAVLQMDPAATAGTPPATALPASASTTEWREQLAADGRSVALATLAPDDLRRAVAAAMAWPDRPLRPPLALAQSWLALVQRAVA